MINYSIGFQFTFVYSLTGPVTYEIINIDGPDLVLKVIASPGDISWVDKEINSNKTTIDHYAKTYLKTNTFEIET